MSDFYESEGGFLRFGFCSYDYFWNYENCANFATGLDLGVSWALIRENPL